MSGVAEPTLQTSDRATQDDERPMSNFDKAMSEFTAFQLRVADEHAHEVAMLEAEKAMLSRQVAELQTTLLELAAAEFSGKSRDSCCSHAVADEPSALQPKAGGARVADKSRKIVLLDDDPEGGSSLDSTCEDTVVKKRISHRSTNSGESSVLSAKSRVRIDTTDGEQESCHSVTELNADVGEVVVVHLSEDYRETASAMLSGHASQATSQFAAEESSMLQASTEGSHQFEMGRERLRSNLHGRMRPTWRVEALDDDQSRPSWSKTSLLTFVEYSEGGSRVHARLSGHGLNTPSRSNLAWVCTNGCMMHPHSPFKVSIDVTGIILLLYDLMVTPLVVFFDLSESKLLVMMGWVTRIFWVLDMVISFNTAVYARGVLVFQRREVAKHYIKTSFFLDLPIVLTEWLSLLLENSLSGSLDSVAVLRVLKAARFVKVVRIIKLESRVQQLRVQINSTVLDLCITPLVLILLLLFLNHVMACAWYGIGTSSNGWTSQIPDSSFAYMYATAYHWAVSQLHGNMEVFPHNLAERIFMCSTMVLALILYSTFLSSITNGMMQIHSLRDEQRQRETKLRLVLSRRKISVELAMSIKKRLQHMAKMRTQLDAEQVLDSLPGDLLLELHVESRRPVVLGCHFFETLDIHIPGIVRQLCHDSMSEKSYPSDDRVFSAGDACLNMFFVMNGDLLYMHKATSVLGNGAGTATGSLTRSLTRISLKTEDTGSKRTVVNPGMFVRPGSWLSEATLWLTWEYCGDLTSMLPALLLLVDAMTFTNVVVQSKPAHGLICRYAAKFVERMIRVGARTDIVPDER